MTRRESFSRRPIQDAPAASILSSLRSSDAYVSSSLTPFSLLLFDSTSQ